MESWSSRLARPRPADRSGTARRILPRPAIEVPAQCAACGTWAFGRRGSAIDRERGLCKACRRGLAALHPLDRVHPSGLFMMHAFTHEGVARTLVHRLKYGGVERAAVPLAEAMAAVLPSTARVLVPVPRVGVRVRAYGVDPALALAEAVGASAGLPVVVALSAPIWWPRQAGRSKIRRRPATFRARAVTASLGSGVVIVDDVVTTGSTAVVAAAAVAGSPSVGVDRVSVLSATGRV